MGCSPLVLILSKDSDIIAPWSDRLTMSREPGLTMSGEDRFGMMEQVNSRRMTLLRPCHYPPIRR